MTSFMNESLKQLIIRAKSTEVIALTSHLEAAYICKKILNVVYLFGLAGDLCSTLFKHGIRVMIDRRDKILISFLFYFDVWNFYFDDLGFRRR